MEGLGKIGDHDVAMSDITDTFKLIIKCILSMKKRFADFKWITNMLKDFEEVFYQRKSQGALNSLKNSTTWTALEGTQVIQTISRQG